MSRNLAIYNMCIQYMHTEGKKGTRATALFLNYAANSCVFFFVHSVLFDARAPFIPFFFILQFLNLYSFGAEKKWNKKRKENEVRNICALQKKNWRKKKMYSEHLPLELNKNMK